MEEYHIEAPLLDTPKRESLQTQSKLIRLDLKAFERDFLEQHGRKPKQNEIKSDLSIAAKYKQYQKVQDVLSGKLTWEKFNEAKNKPVRRSTSRKDSGIGSSPSRVGKADAVQATPRKQERPSYELDPYDAPGSASPQVHLRTAIGPTPHRDGKILGLFDMLQHSGSTGAQTPSSSTRKRKLDDLYRDTPMQRTPLKVTQTPSRRNGRRAGEGDILDYLSGTPQKNLEGLGQAKLSRTPRSEGRKFQLSQFFATPSTQRVLFAGSSQAKEVRTPLRDRVLGQTPQREPEKSLFETTPAYLKRSTSFKDRLLSASQTAEAAESNTVSIPNSRRSYGPPTLRHFRSSTSNVLTMKDVNARLVSQRATEDADDGFEDDLDALHDMENEGRGPQTLVEDSQFGLGLPPSSPRQQPHREVVAPYKKKGQKRTTKKSNIKPAMMPKAAAEPKFVASENSEDEEEEDGRDKENADVIEETQFLDHISDGDSASDMDDQFDDVKAHNKKARKSKGKQGSSQSKSKRKAGTINPNAQSHMNFRTLKIKNKNSKAKGGARGKFGRRR